MKEFNDQVMKFKITNDKLKMEIKLSDLAWLLKNSPNNIGDNGDEDYCHVRKGKNKEFAEYVINMLMDESPNDGNNTRWAEPFENIFEEVMESVEDGFIKYNEYED